MSAFLDWFFAFMTTMIDGVWKMLSGIGSGLYQVFNIPAYIAQFNAYKYGFSPVDWIFSVLSFLAVALIWLIIFSLILITTRKYIRFRRTLVGKEDLLEELARLHRDVLKLTQERERILGLKVGVGMPVPAEPSELPAGENEARTTAEAEGEQKPAALNPVRFARLDAIDRLFEDYVPPVYEENYTLEQLCDNFRNFACSRMGLFYEKKVIRQT